MTPAFRTPSALTALAALAGGLLLLGGGCAQPAAPAEEAIAPTYTALARQVFSNCTTRSCHGETARGGLDLRAENAYGQLVGVPASNERAASRGKRRVVPSDPDASYLLQKLVAPAADEGERMPLSGAPLSPGEIAAIRAWIAQGAQRN